MEPKNHVHLIGALKEDAFCLDQYSMATLRIEVPIGKKMTTMTAVCNDDIYEQAKHCYKGDVVDVTGQLYHYKNKKTDAWQTQVRADGFKVLSSKEPPIDTPKQIDLDDLPF